MLSKLQLFAKNCLKKHPIITNSVIYGTLYVSAEYSQQKFNQKYMNKKFSPREAIIFVTLLGFIQEPTHPPVDYAALPRFAFVGSCVYSPVLYIWYNKVLEKYVVGKTASIVVKKLILDQFFMTPIMLVLFYTTMSILERREDIFAELRAKFMTTFIANQIFWLPGQTINFALVPQQLRVVYIASASFVWINLLCWIKRNQNGSEKEQIE